MSEESDLSDRRYTRVLIWGAILAVSLGATSASVVLKLSESQFARIVTTNTVQPPTTNTVQPPTDNRPPDEDVGNSTQENDTVTHAARVAPAALFVAPSIGMITVGVSMVTLIVSAIGTASAVLLGWRTDRRQTTEFKLKIQQLERDLAKSREQGAPKRLDTAL